MSTNESYRKVALTRGRVSPEDVFVVRNGPVLRKFKAVPPNPALKYGKTYLVGYVGIMSSQEGLDILLDVAERIRGQDPAIRDALIVALDHWSFCDRGSPMKSYLLAIARAADQDNA